ncbi:MAG: GNAT family N-acetyltransferase [Anaerolineae bacterium]|nr:GNAT family N-acetyltransferase [Anaerolineae bacterium]
MTDSLPDDVLNRRAILPLKPEPVVLAGANVRLEPFDPPRHLEALYAVSNGSSITWEERSIGAYDADALIWRYMFGGPFESLGAFGDYLDRQSDAPNGLSLCVVDIPTGRPVGIANFMNNVPEHLKIELGNIWYSPIAQRTRANTEGTYLMLRHAFALGYRRVEWKCDSRNERSRRAALRMGFRFEGIQEQHMIVKGRSRDTAWFRILDHEWPGVQAHLEGLLW